jgi:hypothetical protein
MRVRGRAAALAVISQLAEEFLRLLGGDGKPGNWVTLMSGKMSAESWLTGSPSKSPMRPLMPPRSSMSLLRAGPAAGWVIQSPSWDQTVSGTSSRCPGTSTLVCSRMSRDEEPTDTSICPPAKTQPTSGWKCSRSLRAIGSSTRRDSLAVR